MASKTPRQKRPESQRTNNFRKEYEPCELCGNTEEVTSHCVHCGKIICHQHRQEHVKEVIEKLKGAKSEAYHLINEARAKKGRIFTQSQDIESQRAKLVNQVEVDFKYLRQHMDQRQAELMVDLADFGWREIEQIQDRQTNLENALAELRKAEMDFSCRLADYTMMDNKDRH